MSMATSLVPPPYLLSQLTWSVTRFASSLFFCVSLITKLVFVSRIALPRRREGERTPSCQCIFHLAANTKRKMKSWVFGKCQPTGILRVQALQDHNNLIFL